MFTSEKKFQPIKKKIMLIQLYQRVGGGTNTAAASQISILIKICIMYGDAICLSRHMMFQKCYFFLEISKKTSYKRLVNSKEKEIKSFTLICRKVISKSMYQYLVYPGLCRFDLKLLGFDAVIVVKELFKENLGAGFGVLGLDDIGLA